MDIAQEAIAVLQDAERRLRDLVASAAAAGEYDAIERITSFARALGALTREAQPTAIPEFTLDDQREGNRSGGVGTNERIPSPLRPNEDPFAQQRPVRRPKRLFVADQYPKFFRQGDQLVKIGWSKKAKEEYEHKAPRWVVDALTAAILGRSRNGKLFTVEPLLPLRNPLSGAEIPSYQAYVALAWFRFSGLVKQHGRRGYSVRNGPRFAEAAAASWLQLVEENA